jgi:hypothetical protein
MDSIALTTISIALLVLQVLAIWGLIYLSEFAFTKPEKDKKNNDNGEQNYCVTMTTFQRNVSRISVVLVWISVIINLFGALFVLSKKDE